MEKSGDFLRARSLFFAGLMLLFSDALAEAGVLVSGNLTGTITRVSDPVGLFEDARAGDLVSGLVLYSTDSADWGFVGTSGDYRNYQAINPNRSTWDLMLVVTTKTKTISNRGALQPLFLFGVQLQDNPSTGAIFDSLAFLAYDKSIFEPHAVVSEVNLNFRDLSGNLFSGSSPLSSINLSSADQQVGEVSFLVDTNGDGVRDTRSSVFSG
jgi:hypothetical protein